MEIKRFSELSSDELNKIINKHFSHWSKYSKEMSLVDVEYKFKNVYAENDELPYGIALIHDNEIIGFCTLRLNELEHYPEFNPWICSVMIFDEYRNQGYGKMLIQYAKEEYKSLNFNEVYLWTDKAPQFYEKIGFKYVQDVLKKDKSGYGKIYSIKLNK